MSSIVIYGDTSGSITLAANTIAGTNTQTLPAATGTVMVSGNMPAFSAYANATQNITSATYTKVQINTELFDTANCFDSTTNYRFTPNVSGYYQINGTIRVAQSAGSTDAIIVLYKNGSAYQRGSEFNGSVAGSIQLNGNWLVYFNGVTDYVELYGYIQGTSPSFNASGSNTTSTFSGVLVRTA